MTGDRINVSEKSHRQSTNLIPRNDISYFTDQGAKPPTQTRDRLVQDVHLTLDPFAPQTKRSLADGKLYAKAATEGTISFSPMILGQ